MKGRKDSSMRRWSWLRVLFAGMLVLVILPPLAAGSRYATYASFAAQALDPDLCEILPSLIGPHIKTPGVGKPGSTTGCVLDNSASDRKWDRISINKVATPEYAQLLIEQGVSPEEARGAEHTRSDAYGDAGHSYETAGKKSSDPLYFIAPKIRFSRGCYLVVGNPGYDIDPIDNRTQVPRPLGPLRELAIAVDQQLKKAPCGQATEPSPPEALRIIKQASERSCPGKNAIAGQLYVSKVPEGVPTDKVPMVVSIWPDDGDTITRFVQVDQPISLNYGDIIHVPGPGARPNDDSPHTEWRVWFDLHPAAGTDPKYQAYSQFALTNLARFSLNCLKEELFPVTLDSGVADVTIKNKDFYDTWPEIIQSPLVDLLPTSPDDRNAASAEGTVFSLNTFRLLYSGPALGDVRAQTTTQVYARFTVDTSDPNKTLIRVHTGAVKAVPANKGGPAITVRAGQRAEAVQGKVNPPVADVSVPGSGSRLFSETFFQVEGIFLDYWNGHGGLAQQGFPISEMTREKSDLNGQTYTVQYFERAVFEYHPELSPPNDVLLSQLGTFRYKQKYPQGAPNQKSNTSAGSRLFTETGKRVGGRFLDYWNRNGGLAQQGLPLSEEFMEVSETDGKTYLVQYFERAVFEYHPENAGKPSEVLLSLLGVSFHKQKYGGGGGGGTTPPTVVPPTAVPVVACGRRVSPEIHAKWQQLGGEAGFLGCPSADEVVAGPSTKGTTGRSVTFSKGDGGIIVLHQSGARAGKAFEVHGCPYLIYSGQGTTKSPLGFPVSDEYDVTGGRRADFEGGYIVWNATTRVCNATLTP